ncbi:hypothetical protein F2Q68_00010722 [Brassica cretica]|uniref:Uncharacterized protein n=1 Tax=Brassica cretica TaxID=69181 RepID=A0A8S9KP15_BRACR|nr:hypothetical protein F2Q68_00010722 [Brassica cretica]
MILFFEERRECYGVDASTLHMREFLLEGTGASFRLRSFLLPVPEMRTESGLSPDSSSIGNRVKSSRLRVAPTESMDSSDSSLDLAVKAENPKAIVAKRASPAGGSRYPLIGPPSVIGAEEVAVWSEKYELPDDVVIRVPDQEDMVSDFGVDEVPVYEVYFVSGIRDHISSLVAKISETLGISQGNLNPPAWRTLIALQNLGDLNGLMIGVAEEPPVRKILKKDRKWLPAFKGNWTEKFAFMHLPAFSSIWQLEELPRVDYSSGKDTIEQVLKLPLERRQIPSREQSNIKALQYPGSASHFLPYFFFIVADSIYFHVLGEMSGSKGDEALAEYKKALKVISARKAAPKQVAPSKDDDEVQIIRSSKHRAVAAAAPSSSKNKSMASCSSPKEEDSSMAIQSLQGDLLQVASQLYHLGDRMEGAASTKVEMDILGSQLCEEKDAALARDKEIKALELKVRNQEETGELVAAENVSLRSQLKNREEELNDLKDAAVTFEAEKAKVVNGAKVVARWELMREWLSGQTDSWDPVNTLEQYKTVKTNKAELLGLPAPSFEYEPRLPGDEEVKKTPEPAADDPPAN